jgi:RNA polymerase sigma factor (sigma-70 family)
VRSHDHRSDAALLTAAGGGEAAAFAELYLRHAAAVHGYCRRVLRSRDEAADATQEAFVNVLERVRDAPGAIMSPRAYLFRAAHNACLRTAERARRLQPVEEPEPAPEAGLPEPERVVLTRELQADVRAANADLPTRQREVLALREVEQLGYDEIAQIMDLTPNGAAQLAWRARANLRLRLRRRAFASVTLATLDCERALGLLELSDDAALSETEHRWLTKHLTACPRCASNHEVLAEVGTTYRLWAPSGAAPLLTVELLRRAGEAVGTAWIGGGGAARARASPRARAATTAVLPSAGAAGAGAVSVPAAGTLARPPASSRRRRPRWRAPSRPCRPR